MISSRENCAVQDTTERYKLVRILSKSPKSQVHLVENPKNHSLHICKFQKTSPDLYSLGQREKFLNEIRLITKLSNKNIIELESFCEQGVYIRSLSHIHDCIFYITEYCPQGNLFNLVTNNSSGLDDDCTKDIFKQIASGLNYLHNTGFAHGDVRLENFLISNNGLIKIIDFEYSKPVNQLSKLYQGSNYYMAPEILSQCPYLPGKSDVFSSGCILFSLYFGCPGFKSATLRDRLYQSLINSPESFWNKFETLREVPYGLKLLLENMLAYDPIDRMSIEDAMRDPWVV